MDQLVKQFSEMQKMMKKMGGMGTKAVKSNRKKQKGKKGKGGGGRVTPKGGGKPTHNGRVTPKGTKSNKAPLMLPGLDRLEDFDFPE